MISLKTVKSKYELFGKQPGYLDERHDNKIVRLEMLSFNEKSVERTRH